MPVQNLAIILILAAGAILAAWLAFYAWKHRSVHGAYYLIFMMLGLAYWAFANAGEYATVDPAVKIIWAKFSYLGIVSTPVLWFTFALGYRGSMGWFKGSRYLLLWIMPVITLVMVATNELHLLIWNKITQVQGPAGSPLIYEFGTGFWFHTAYSYLMIGVGTVILFVKILRAQDMYRRQVAMFIGGALFPVVANILVISGLNPFPGIDLTPLFFTITGVLFAIAIFRFQALDIIPIAREALIENLADGILVLDNFNRILDINPKASEWIGLQTRSAAGATAQQVLEKWPGLFENLATHPKESIETQNEPNGWLEWRLTPVLSKAGSNSGHVIIIRDVTGNKKGDLALQEYTRELENRNAELDAFALAVARDLKRPLSTILSAGRDLETEIAQLGSKHSRDLIDGILRSSRQMNSSINSLNLLSDLRKRKAAEFNSVNMYTVYENVISRLSDLIDERKAQIEHPEQWPIVKGFTPWVEEILYNYLTNAIQYGGKPPRVIVGFESCPPAPGAARLIRFYVVDNGNGMSIEQQQGLFVDFRNLEQVRVEGRGLGLVVVRGLVEKMGGQVSVSSKPGAGSQFSFTLPQIDSVL